MKRGRYFAFLKAVGLALCGAGLLILPQIPAEVWGQTGGPDVQALVRQMTLDEKLSLVHGTADPQSLGEAGYWPGVPRLGIRPLRMADGPNGVSVNKPSTGMPAPIGVAASFDPEAAELYGKVIGSEAHALQIDMMLGPHINIDRDPTFARNQTTFGEDPYLSGAIGSAVTKGIQSEGTIAMLKHTAAYNGSGNVVVDERALREIYLPAFETSIQAGGVAIMCSYNKINGPYSCNNNELQNGIIRGQLGFRGFFASDWGATHETEAIEHGLDLEMPGARPNNPNQGFLSTALASAIKQEQIPMSALDTAIGHILEAMNERHLLASAEPLAPGTIDVEGHARSIQKIAEEGAVLLKNDQDILPLSRSDLNSLALIGPTAGQLAVEAGAERGYGFEERFVSPLAELEKQAGSQAKIAYAVGDDLTGVPLSGAALSHDGLPGLLRHQTKPQNAVDRADADMDFHGDTALLPGTQFSWSGTLKVPTEGDYVLMLQANVGGGANGTGSITIDGNPVFTARGGVVPPGFGGLNPGPNGAIVKKWASLLPTTDGRNNARSTVHLKAGAHLIEITASSTGSKPFEIRFNWSTPEARQQNIEKAAATAKSAHTAVVFAWAMAGTDGNNNMNLPEDQNELIEKVAAANPRTVVVMNTGAPEAMPWLKDVRGVLQLWFAGQEGGEAVADLLVGKANPGGKLPLTFPAKLEDTAVYAPGHPERVPKTGPGNTGATLGDADAVTFSEGIFVGYRWFDSQKIKPLFPFGYGLSYTEFKYSGLKVTAKDGGWDVTFTVENIGKVGGAEVAEIYVGAAAGAPVPMAVNSLAGFERVELAAGQSKQLTRHVDQRALSYWSSESHGWVKPAGTRTISVGSSSRDLKLTANI